MITVPNKGVLNYLPNKIDKEYALVTDGNEMYQYNKENNSWAPVEIKFTEGGPEMTLFDINRAIFECMDPMTDEQLQYAHGEIFKFLGEAFEDNDNEHYWALINWNKRYITIFHHNNDSDEELSDIIMEVIEDLGEVKDITLSEHGAFEIWITDENDTDCYVLFNYDQGVVEGIA